MSWVAEGSDPWMLIVVFVFFAIFLAVYMCFGHDRYRSEEQTPILPT